MGERDGFYRVVPLPSPAAQCGPDRRGQPNALASVGFVPGAKALSAPQSHSLASLVRVTWCFDCSPHGSAGSTGHAEAVVGFTCPKPAGRRCWVATAGDCTLDTVHHSALRVATGAFRTSPASSLLAESHEAPLLLRRQLLGMRYALKLRQFPEHPAYPYVFSQGFLSLFEGTTHSSTPFCLRIQDLFARSDLPPRGVRRLDTMTSPPWKSVCPEIDISLSDVKKAELSPTESNARALEHLSAYQGWTLTFTDGSKTEEGVGCAFVSGRNTRSFSLPKHATVFSSELIAIAKALFSLK